MSEAPKSFEDVKAFFDKKINDHGPVPAGLDCRDDAAVTVRYDQILKVVDRISGFSIMDYGCGYGGLAPYMDGKGFSDFHYIGRDFSSAMIENAIRENSASGRKFEVGVADQLPLVDYTVASGVFNIKLDTSFDEWEQYTLSVLQKLYDASTCGIAANFLTGYSDADRKRPDLFYPSPERMFTFGKSLSRNVALLHDYEIYDFTLVIRRPLAPQS
jgi:SAM-dependent methyltransferase